MSERRRSVEDQRLVSYQIYFSDLNLTGRTDQPFFVPKHARVKNGQWVVAEKYRGGPVFEMCPGGATMIQDFGRRFLLQCPKCEMTARGSKPKRIN